jgi:uncharacterized membrane-anchored protein
MGASVSIGESETARLAPHPLRTAILGEVHTEMAAPARILHFGFDTAGERGAADRAQLVALCESRGLQPPRPQEKHFRMALGATMLRWEQHSEFTTYTWEMPADGAAPFLPTGSTLASPMRLVPPPGPVLVAVDLHLLPDGERRIAADQVFDRTSMAIAENAEGNAIYATDFRLDPDGFLRILVADRGMSRERAGSLVQHVLDMETYRTLALLGLPEAQRLSPSIAATERRLTEATDRMRRASHLTANHQLLDELSSLAADVEAAAAASQFRFGASRAYDEIVRQRLQSIGERKLPNYPTWSTFLARRMAPALRTCAATEARLASLSLRLARAANLLRTRVDVELEQQNQELLKSMNARTRLQLRLQSTVEGLSVAAITYYVVGLFAYLVKALHDTGRTAVEPSLLTAAFVPVAALSIWGIVRRIRRRHIAEEE